MEEETIESLDDEIVAQKAPAPGSVTVNGTRYAVGLMWAPLQNPDDPIPEIREAMETEPGVDLYCQRTAASPQYGLGRTEVGHTSGEPALAASVAEALSDKVSVCGVFKVDEGWWFIAIRNDLILAEEDILYTTEDEARRAFMKMMAVPDWAVRIVPDNWNVEGTVHQSVEQLIKGTRKTRLFELSATKKTQILILLALVFLGVAVAVGWAIVSIVQVVMQPEKIVVLPTPEIVKPVEPAPEKPKPWEKVPDTEVFLNKCWNNSYQLSSIVIPGWQMEKVVCTPTGITTGWRMSWERGGRAVWLKMALEEYKLNKISVKIDDSLTAAQGSIQFDEIPKVASIPRLTAAQLKEQLIDINQATGLSVQFSEQSLVDPPNNADGTVPPNQKTYQFYSVSISSPYTPWEWLTFFDKFPGLEFLKVEYDPNIGSENKWTYEGRIYAK